MSTILLSLLLPFLVLIPATVLTIYCCCFKKGRHEETDALREAENKRLEAEEVSRLKLEKMHTIKERAEETARRL